MCVIIFLCVDQIEDEKDRIIGRLKRCAEAMKRQWNCVPLDKMPLDPSYQSPTIYFLSDGSGDVKRAGHTTQKLGTRVSQYKREHWFSEVEKVCYTTAESLKEAKMIEKALIGCTCPPFNKQLKKPYCPVD